MENNSSQNKAKRIQLVLTIGLGSVLAVLVAGYIYYGMQLAKQASDSAVSPDAANQTPSQASPELTREEKLQILDSLAKNSSSTPVSDEQKKATLENLSKDNTSNTMTEADKQKILEQLSKHN
jgi:hypothetical protein